MFQINYKNKIILALSDTHGKHRELDIPLADIMIHCGDACVDGNIDELADFFAWYAELPIKSKIFIPGNHDFPLELDIETQDLIPQEIICLENKSIDVDGIIIGALSPYFFYQETFASKSQAVDVLITHGPPIGILDNGFGCEHLLDYVLRAKPKYHFFGHIHDACGTLIQNGIHFVNISQQ